MCRSRRMEKVLPLTPTALCDAYVTSEHVHEKQEVFPLDLFLCRDCGYVHLPYVVNPETIYRNYIYVTTSSMGLANHFARYAASVLNRCRLKDGSLIIDLGSNDGTLLGFFQKAGFRVLGVDPAREIAQQASRSGIPTIPEFFTVDLARKIRADQGPASAMTVNNLLANIDDLEGVMEAVRICLADDGVFIVESSYLGDLIQNRVFDFIYHEHLSYFSILPLRSFLRRFDLELVDLEPIETKGGSMRYYFQPMEAHPDIHPVVGELEQKERNLKLDQPRTYERFARIIDQCKKDTIQYLDPFQKQGSKIAGYGGSATSTTLIYHFGLRDYLDFIFDDNPAKHNTFSPGWHIPVLPSEELYSQNPACVLILAWRYFEPIVRKHGKYLDQGGNWLIPLPECKWIGGLS
ncbi:MAG: class I SAM-dependent methyltransferase [Sedimentisphaerales bacterium]|nr:class I SAM-dependent methyltransferase [Sedimentisphaerales bacterium]